MVDRILNLLVRMIKKKGSSIRGLRRTEHKLVNISCAKVLSQDEIDIVGEGHGVQGGIVTLKQHESEDICANKCFSDMFSLDVGDRFASFTEENFLVFKKKVIGEGKESASFKRDDIKEDIALLEAVVNGLASVITGSEGSSIDAIRKFPRKMEKVAPFVAKLNETDQIGYWLLLRFQVECMSTELMYSSHAGFGKRVLIDYPELKNLDMTVYTLFQFLLCRGYVFAEPVYSVGNKPRNGLVMGKKYR